MVFKVWWDTYLNLFEKLEANNVENIILMNV